MAPPTVRTSKCSSDFSESSSASVKSVIIETTTVVVHDWKLSLLETVVKIAVLLDETVTRFDDQGLTLMTNEHHDIHSHAASYIRKLVGEQILATLNVDNSQTIDQ